MTFCSALWRPQTSQIRDIYPFQIKNERRTYRQRPILRVPVQSSLHLLIRSVRLVHVDRLGRYQRVLLYQQSEIGDPVIRHSSAASFGNRRRVLQHRPGRAQRVDEDLSPVRRQQMTGDFSARFPRHLQHDRPPVQEKID